MLKKALWSVGVILAVVVSIALLQMLASETGEVVVLETRDSNGTATTRLWVVEDEGYQWLRGGPASGWQQRLSEHPVVTLERAGVSRRYRAHRETDRIDRINELMAAKYGWRDTVVGLFVGDRSGDVPIRLEPLPEG